MTKVVLTNPATFVSDATAVAQITANNAALVAAVENTLSRDGTAPNQMNGAIDMNSNRILNLPAPASNNEPARFVDIGNAPASATAAAASATQTAADVVSTHADVVLTHADVVLTHADVVTTAANVQALSATSASSLLISTGAKVFATQTGKLFIPGQFLQIASQANNANFMHGQVTTYASGTLTMNVTDIGGAGTFADWQISISGTQGSQGIQGNTGPTGATGISGVPTVNQFATWLNATTIQGTSITGLVKGNGASVPTAAIAGTDYQVPIGTISGVAKGNGANLLTAATAGTDYVAPGTATTFSAQQTYTLATITDQATLAWPVSSGQKAIVTLGANRTMGVVTGAVQGATYSLWVAQDTTGSRTIAWTTTGAGSFDFGTAGAPTLTTTASKADLLTFEAVSLAGTLKLRFTGIMRGFS